MGYKIKIIILLLFIGGFSAVSAQVSSVVKVGDNPYTINEDAVLDVESTTKGFLPPRMTKAQRDAISSPPAGLLVWCTNCNISTEPASGELSVYLGSGWSELTTNTTPVLTTSKKNDTNGNNPVRVSATSATINGILVSRSGATPTETGIVWKEILDGEFGILPLLDGVGTATTPNYKTTSGTVVTADNGKISVTIPTLTSSTSNKRPYYFRTYAKTPLGIGYGNTIIFNCAPPTFSTPTVTDGTTLFPKFDGKLYINAGTPKGAIVEYGYVSGTSTSPTGNKVVLSDNSTITSLNTTLNSETLTSNIEIELDVDKFDVKTLEKTYFRYYVTLDASFGGGTVYSSEVSFTSTADAITGGSAIATVTSVDAISSQFKARESITRTIKVNFNVSKAGTYDIFKATKVEGTTTGISLADVPAGTFAAGNQALTFTVSGTADTSLEGNSFTVSRIADKLNTGMLLPGVFPVTGNSFRCDNLYETTVSPITSTTGKVWMDRNLGAGRAPNSISDVYAYGCMYQWGRGNDGHASVVWTSATSGGAYFNTTTSLSATDTPGNNNFIIRGGGTANDWRSPSNSLLWQGKNGINNPCPAGYRVPTSVEWAAEGTNLSITNRATAYSSLLKLQPVGYRSGNDGTFTEVGVNGGYASSTTSGTTYYLMYYFTSTTVIAANPNIRISGMSVRCIRD